MTNIRKAVIASVLLGSAGLLGCGGGAYYAVAVGPPPPPPVYGAVGYAPGPGFVWMDGYYDLRGRNWVWVGGHWGRAPHRGARWVAPRWEHRGGGYRFHQGHWRR